MKILEHTSRNEALSVENSAESLLRVCILLNLILGTYELLAVAGCTLTYLLKLIELQHISYIGQSLPANSYLVGYLLSTVSQTSLEAIKADGVWHAELFVICFASICGGIGYPNSVQLAITALAQFPGKVIRFYQSGSSDAGKV